MKTRNLESGELLNLATQRSCPNTFTMVARVSGKLSETMLAHGLRLLERRHPMLRARVVRGDGPARFELGSALPIPLRVERAPADAWLPFTERSITHRWTDEGPRAAVTWLQHDAERSTILFTGDHLTGDGKSAMLAVRDLLRFSSYNDENVAELPSPGQAVVLPPDLGSLKNRMRGLGYVLSSALAGQCDRPRVPGAFPIAGRNARVQHFTLERAASEQLAKRARSDGTTIHGVLGAAFAIAIAQVCGRDMRQRILHPIDLRQYGRPLRPGAAALGEAYGFYVSGAETDHEVTRSASLGTLARGITTAVRAKKASGEPLISSPVAGGIMTKMAALMSAQQFCNFAESSLFKAAFAMTHIGRIEALGIAHDEGPVHIDELFGTTTGSVLTPMAVGGMLWGGKINVTVSNVEPLIPYELAHEVVLRGRRYVEAYAQSDRRLAAVHAT